MLNPDTYTDEEDLWDEESDSIENSYLIVSVNSMMYAFRLEKVQEIIKLPEIQTYPEMSEFERGFIKLRDDIIRITDLRKKLKYRSFAEEEADFLFNIQNAREAHLEWIEQLEYSVRNNSEFKLTSDPHKCKFGMWYNNFKSNNSAISMFMQQFDLPHKRIHQLADRVKSLMKDNRIDDAIKLIDNTRDTDLKLLLELFDSTQKQLVESRREIAVIFHHSDQLIGCTADSVLNILEILPESIEPPTRIESKEYIAGIAKTKDGVILIIDDEKLI